ncbi:hypothetical protein ACQEU3_22465 [Spirillospora sp. CA-253888]
MKRSRSGRPGIAATGGLGRAAVRAGRFRPRSRSGRIRRTPGSRALSAASSRAERLPSMTSWRSTPARPVTPGSVAYRPACPAAAGPRGVSAAARRRSAPVRKSAWSACETRQVVMVVTDSTPTAIAMTSSSAGPE